MDGDSDLSMFNKEDGGGGAGPEGSKAAKNSDSGAAEVAAAKSGDAEAGKGASSPSQPRLSNGKRKNCWNILSIEGVNGLSKLAH